MPPTGAQIGGGFTEGELSFASFWVRHRSELSRLLYGTLIVLNVGFWLYTLWGLLDAYAISYPRESRITAEIANDQLTMDALAVDHPQNVQSDNVMVFQGTDGRFDMAVDIQNPNDQWWADFNYRFNLSGELTPLRNGYIMPQTKSTLTELGFKPKTRGGTSAQLEVDNVHWHRVDPAQVGPKYSDYQLNHFNVSFDNIQYQNNLNIGTKQVARTSFDITNHGSFGYWTMDLVIKLYRADSVIAVNKITVAHLSPNETRHIDLDWFDTLPSSISKTEIIPEINFLDPASYLPTQQFTQP